MLYGSLLLHFTTCTLILLIYKTYKQTKCKIGNRCVRKLQEIETILITNVFNIQLIYNNFSFVI